MQVALVFIVLVFAATVSLSDAFFKRPIGLMAYGAAGGPKPLLRGYRPLRPLLPDEVEIKERRAPSDPFDEWEGMLQTLDNLRKPRFGR
ncbi:hypothetical protein QR680_007508 [Steinernema hermaphroditum]|uniref:Uncharacterized protein n=1 Tax=Steinernema hermaphroditum TaxID=289476 RepID=A0AA39IDD4_9BILA|nr:hypothetical protein QR680_007508 [Steinernema hermaphroditum]